MKSAQVSGKRKRAIARASIKKGTGIVKINLLNLNAYGPEIAQLMIKEPILIAGDIAKKVDINITVRGGGWHSQADAARLVVAKALATFSGSKDLKAKYLEYDRHLLVSDVRRTEPSKPNDSKPRAKRQKSYR